MAQKGEAVKVGRGVYDLATSTKNYILHLREQARRRDREAASHCGQSTVSGRRTLK